MSASVWTITHTPIASIIPAAVKGVARIEHRTPDRFSILRESMRGRMLSEKKLACLSVNGRLMMSDGDEEWRSNAWFMHRANGKVLIAGLGIGMVLSQLLPKPEVESILVVEKYQDVIDLVGPHFQSEKLNVVCGDIFVWNPPKGALFDTIYFDIWPDICTDNLEGIAKLHRRFASKLNRANSRAWMGSWEQEYLRSLKRRGA